jgi:hypothetical protein
MKLIAKLNVAAGILAFSANAAYAADVTMVSGFYKKSNVKIEGKTKGYSSTVSFGGRYQDDLSTDTAWIGQTSVKMRSYTGSNGNLAPDNSVSILVGGGIRYYFQPFTTAVVPYVSGIVNLQNEKNAKWTATGYTETTESGLYYGANAGIRAGLGEKFFVELEMPFFFSPLFGVTSTETVTQTGDTSTRTKDESTDTSLFASSSGSINDVRLGVGMKL